MLDIEQANEFVWDQGNLLKSLKTHGITIQETEEVFLNFKVSNFDASHSINEPRYQIVGQTNLGKILFVVCTIRDAKVRVISSRIASKKERISYEKALQKGT